MTRWTLHHGDALDVLRTLPDASVDAVVTDPPAGIAFMGKDWDGHKGGRAAWVAWLASILAECYRVTKPGGRILCWSIPRTSHWTGCAVEDAGWLIENTVAHMFGSGFPKGKSQLKPAREDWWLARKPGGKVPPLRIDDCRVSAAAEAPRAAWNGTNARTDGWGMTGYDPAKTTTAGRWPANVLLSHSPPVLDEAGNVIADGCERVGERRVQTQSGSTVLNTKGGVLGWGHGPRTNQPTHHDPDGLETVADYRCVESCPVRMLDEQSGERPVSGAARNGRPSTADRTDARVTSIGPNMSGCGVLHDDTGTASRFFQQFEPDPFVYVAKASRRDRNAGCEGLPFEWHPGDEPATNRSGDTLPIAGTSSTRGNTTPNRGNVHPTVKPTALMRHLVRLIAAPGDLVLDPFNGSGSTGRGALLEGCRYIGIEREAEYVEIARARLAEADTAPTQMDLLAGIVA